MGTLSLFDIFCGNEPNNLALLGMSWTSDLKCWSTLHGGMNRSLFGDLLNAPSRRIATGRTAWPNFQKRCHQLPSADVLQPRQRDHQNLNLTASHGEKNDPPKASIVPQVVRRTWKNSLVPKLLPSHLPIRNYIIGVHFASSTFTHVLVCLLTARKQSPHAGSWGLYHGSIPPEASSCNDAWALEFIQWDPPSVNIRASVKPMSAKYTQYLSQDWIAYHTGMLCGYWHYHHFSVVFPFKLTYIINWGKSHGQNPSFLGKPRRTTDCSC